jgi:hypothetical protein
MEILAGRKPGKAGMTRIKRGVRAAAVVASGFEADGASGVSGIVGRNNSAILARSQA